MKLFNETPHRGPRALQAYLILIGLAANRQTITYGGLARRMGYTNPKGGAQHIAQHLWPLLYWAEREQLPLISVLVVNTKTGLPGWRGPFSGEEAAAETQRVFNYDWAAIYPPTIEELESAFAEREAESEIRQRLLEREPAA